MDNDAARHVLTEAVGLLQEHMADLAVVEVKRAALSATAIAAGGTVTVTVDAFGVVSHTAVDETYWDDHELADLGDHVTEAARAAARDVARQTAELLAPLAERRAGFPSLSDIVDGAPDVRVLVSPRQRLDLEHHEEGADRYPTVRSDR